jgi:hypothetical protein
MMARQFGKAYRHFPDVLFATTRLLGHSRRDRPASAGRLRIGVNLHEKRAASAVAALTHGLGSRVTLIPVTTHSPIFESPYEWGHGAPGGFHYNTIKPFLQDLQTLDAIISDKLHVGLVAATQGTPFLSYQAKAKTLALHQELGVAGAISATAADLVRSLTRLADEEPLPTLAQAIIDQRLDESAMGHLDYLRERLAGRGST